LSTGVRNSPDEASTEGIPLLAEEGRMRHQLKVAKPPISAADGVVSSGEIFRPEQLRRTDHPGAVAPPLLCEEGNRAPLSTTLSSVCGFAKDVRSHRKRNQSVEAASSDFHASSRRAREPRERRRAIVPGAGRGQPARSAILQPGDSRFGPPPATQPV